tara:strand:+ start:490 stop:1062 length:573 start_codon:yes stop_codon:yes gene_type:complete
MQLGLGPTRVHQDMQDYCVPLEDEFDFGSFTNSDVSSSIVDASGANISFTVTGNHDSIGGLNDNLKVVVNLPDPSLETADHQPIRGTDSEIAVATVGCRYQLDLKVFFPTGNTLTGIYRCRLNGGDLVLASGAGFALNTWHTITGINLVAGNTPGDGLEIGIVPGNITSREEFDNSDIVYFNEITVKNIT